MRPDCEYNLGNDRLQESEKEKDLGVIIHNRLSPEEHIQEIVRNMHDLLAYYENSTYLYWWGNGKENNYIFHTSYTWACSSSMEPPFEKSA